MYIVAVDQVFSIDGRGNKLVISLYSDIITFTCTLYPKRKEKHVLTKIM